MNMYRPTGVNVTPVSSAGALETGKNILTAAQQNRLNAVGDMLSPLATGIEKYGGFDEYRRTSTETFLNTPDNMMNPFQMQSVLQNLGKVRLVEQVYPHLNDDQKKLLIQIETALMPMFIACVRGGIEAGGIVAEQCYILDILSLSAITSEETKLLEGLQNNLDASVANNEELKAKLKKIKDDWQRLM